MEAAPLYGIAEAPVPEGGRAFWLQGKDGAQLRAALFPAKGKAAGSVVLSPGRTEPIEKYFEVIGELQGRGLAVLVHDWRGQGLSARALPDRLRGHADGHAAFLSDYGLMLDAFADMLPQPWIGLAHSMGGGLALLAVSQGEHRLSGLLASAPMIGLTAVPMPPAMAEIIANATVAMGLGSSLLQTYDPVGQPFEGNVLTHDRVRYERYMAQLRAYPDLAIAGPTWSWLKFALGAGLILARPATAQAVRIPLTVISAGQDLLVTNAPAHAFAKAAPQGRYLEIKQARHEILMEVDAVRTVFWQAFDALVLEVRSQSV